MVGSHRYWRITSFVTPNNELGFAEAWLLTAPGGSQIPVSVASASSFHSTGYEASKAVDNNAATQWAKAAFSDPIFTAWFRWDLGSAQTPGALTITARNDFSGGGGQAPTQFILQSSDDNSTWEPEGLLRTTAFSRGETKEFDLADLITDIEATKSTAMVVAAALPDIRLTKTFGFAVVNFPTDFIEATKSTSLVVSTAAPDIRLTKAVAFAVCRGKIDNPRITSWSYTLDGHDYYVLRLGTDGKTLIFDVSTGQWSWWSTDGSQRWRPNTGMNWVSSGDIPHNYGSNVIVGDDSYGALWILNPDVGIDDALLGDGTNTFPRVATGQMITRDRNFVPVYSVDLSASLGEPALADNTVTLEYSDDQGHNYITADTSLVCEEGNYDQEFSWRSLGMVRAPGRLFRISDDGAFARIDGLYVNE